MKAKEIRKYARESLEGKWLKAGAVGLVASLLGGSITAGNYSASMGGSTETDMDWLDLMMGSGKMDSTSAIILAVLLGIFLLLTLWAIVMLIIGGASTLGYAKYNLKLVDHNEPEFADLFSQYNRLGTGFGLVFLRGLFVTLWSMLLLIPGIIAAYSYYMAPFILCENTDMTARAAIKESKQLMKGNKWRLFCLELSFYGWFLLSALVYVAVILAISVPALVVEGGYMRESTEIAMILLGIIISLFYILAVRFFLAPYITAAVAVFYREICREKYANTSEGTEVIDCVYEEVSENNNLDDEEI